MAAGNPCNLWDQSIIHDPQECIIVQQDMATGAVRIGNFFYFLKHQHTPLPEMITGFWLEPIFRRLLIPLAPAHGI